MKANIPIYNIDQLAGTDAGQLGIYYTETQFNNPNTSIHIPYRSNYFGIGICVKGKATLKANLETYSVEQNCLVTMSPHVIKQWVAFSPMYKTIAVFFTKEFLYSNKNIKAIIESLSFFDSNAQYVSKLNPRDASNISLILNLIQIKLNDSHKFTIDILRNLVEILIYETAALYKRDALVQTKKLSRAQQITVEFKKLVCLHYINERSVQFYAGLLYVTPKHLTETVKEVSGKSAKEWIDELVILESKILLQDPGLSVADIADRLHFGNQAIFGKFFKNLTGYAPIAYRRLS